MNTSGIYHRPESEYASIVDATSMCVRLKTARDDIKEAFIIFGDPYDLEEKKWYQQELAMEKIATTSTADYWEVTIESSTSRVQYGFHVIGQDGLAVFYGDQGIVPFTPEILEEANRYFRMPYFQLVDQFQAPDWVKQTVWYQIFPERFANGDFTNDPKGTLPWGSKTPGRDDFFGGDLRGIINHLDDLASLGVNGLYLTPIFKAKTNHKYDTIDYLEIDPDFGDKATFKELVEKAHLKGMRIMLDAVFNHLGDFSREWRDVVENGEHSKYKDWFHILQFPVGDYATDTGEVAADLNYHTFAYTPHMPKLNTANPEVQQFLLQVATYWIREFDIDAWRLDVANEVDHQFWKKFHKAVLNEKSDLYILGEIWHSSQKWLEGDEFHAVMNYAFTDQIKKFFIEEASTQSMLMYGLNEQQMLYADTVNQVAFNLLDSHDTKRILTAADNHKDKVKAAFTFMFLQKGTPCLYYGTEISMTGENDPECRKCMEWDEQKQDLATKAFFTDLISFRKKHWRVIEEGKRTWVFHPQDPYVVHLIVETADEMIEAIFNYGKTPFTSPSALALSLENRAQKQQDQLVIDPYGFGIVTQAKK